MLSYKYAINYKYMLCCDKTFACYVENPLRIACRVCKV